MLEYIFIPWGNAYYENATLLHDCPSFGHSYDKQRSLCWARKCSAGELAPAGCWTGPKMCQHGQLECDADSLEACAMAVYPDAKDHAPFVTCFEGEHASNLSFVRKCASVAGLDPDSIEACVADKARSTVLDRALAQRTAQLGDAKKGTPWVLVDGKNLEETGALLATVCSAWTAKGGTAPAGCVRQMQLP